MKKLLIILDPAHGVETPGKRSPDGKHREFRWSRERLLELDQALTNIGYDVRWSNTEISEIGLSKRVANTNNIKPEPGQKKLLISLHNNAAGNMEQWMTASGVEIFTSPGQTGSDIFAEILMNQLREDFPNLKYRVDKTDGDQDKEERFTVLMGSSYQAVLLEWLFQDNKEDVEKLNNPEINKALVHSIQLAVETYNEILL